MVNKHKQRKIASRNVRKKMERDILQYYKRGRKAPKEDDVNLDSDEYGLDDTVEIPVCSCVGDCCVDRYIPVEPSDVWRLIRNDAVVERWGKRTTDLYVDGGPLIYDIDANFMMPGGAIIRKLSDNGRFQKCPFLETDKPGCILGEDKLTYCKADPITRKVRRDGARNINGWSYINNSMTCIGCSQADREKMRTIKISDWLVEHGMEERFKYLDIFQGFNAWLAGTSSNEFHRKLAALLLFNWHKISEVITEMEVMPDEKPGSPEEIFVMARGILECIMISEKK